MRMKERLGRWVEFWTGPVEALPLRIFEVAFAGTFLLRLTRNFPVAEWLTEEGFHLTSAEWATLGYPAAFPLLPLWGAWLYVAGMAAAWLVLALRPGWRRWALGALFVGAVYAQGVDYLSASSANKQSIMVFAILLTGPGLWRDITTGRWMVSAATVRALQATLLVLYFSAGWAKAFAGDWLKYSDVLFTQVQGVHRSEVAAWALRTLIGWRRLRPVGFFLGIGMHLIIALLMANLIFFSLQMWAYYALFVSAERWGEIGRVGMFPRQG